MLAIFHGSLANPPDELHSPVSENGSKKPKDPDDLLSEFVSSRDGSISMKFDCSVALAYSRLGNPASRHQRLFCGFDDTFCLFLGSLNNLCVLNKQYGLAKGSSEAMFVIEAYRTLRDRGPYPADQVIRELDGSYGFVIYDSKACTVFVALGTDDAIKLYWGIVADGSVVISDDVNLVKAGCGRSFAPFPPGFMFHGEGGLMSFEHPMNKIRAMPRIDSEGVLCGANFKVDTCTRINSMPRRGSEANWIQWDSHV